MAGRLTTSTEPHGRGRGLPADALLALLLALAALVGTAWAVRFARPVFLNFGPNDADYVSYFRSDWEPEGHTRFHWTDVRAQVALPLRVYGTGHVLRLRVRRHFVEPARVTLRVEGRVAARFEVRAEHAVGWRVLDFALPELDGRLPFQLEIDAPSDNPRPLGIALDWMEIERGGPSARLALLTETRLRLALVIVLFVFSTRAAGLPRRWTAGLGAILVLLALVGAAWDALALERILREGTVVWILVGLAATLGLRRSVVRRALGLSGTSDWITGVLMTFVLLALAVRLVLLLHPQFYYPDVRVHAVFARELAKTGLAAFLRDFTANQYRFSLGLQFEHGHWYAFPYPPAFYIACWPLLQWLRMGPEVAVSVLAAVVNSLETLLVFAIGRRLSSRLGVALLAAGAVPLLPIFVTRLSLAYFPALVGHAVDTLVVLYLLARLRRLHEPRVIAALGLLVAAALLTYTQSLLNWGLLLPLFLGVWLVRDHSREARPRQIGLVIAGALGALLSLAFYGRYVPIVLDMQRGIPMAEERVLEEKRAAGRPAQAAQQTLADVEESDDPFAGPDLDLGRGVRKAAWRLYLFYDIFAPAVLAGLLLTLRRSAGFEERIFVAVWALAYLLLNLASGGLPGPNLVRYNKDLEIVAPLFCVALGHVALALWDRWRTSAWVFALAFQALGVQRLVRGLTEKFFAIR